MGDRREIIGFLSLNPERKEDRQAIKELWGLVSKTARGIAVYQLEREIKEGLRPEIEGITIYCSDSQVSRPESSLTPPGGSPTPCSDPLS